MISSINLIYDKDTILLMRLTPSLKCKFATLKIEQILLISQNNINFETISKF